MLPLLSSSRRVLSTKEPWMAQEVSRPWMPTAAGGRHWGAWYDVGPLGQGPGARNLGAVGTVGPLCSQVRVNRTPSTSRALRNIVSQRSAERRILTRDKGLWSVAGGARDSGFVWPGSLVPVPAAPLLSSLTEGEEYSHTHIHTYTTSTHTRFIVFKYSSSLRNALLYYYSCHTTIIYSF